MFEYLIETDGEFKIVGLQGLLEEIEKAFNDDNYCFCAYEIGARLLDYSLPRESDEALAQEDKA